MRFASVAQLVEQGTENPRVVGSIPIGGTICGFSSFGRARPCQGRGGGIEPRNPLHYYKTKIQLVAESLVLQGFFAFLGEKSTKNNTFFYEPYGLENLTLSHFFSFVI